MSNGFFGQTLEKKGLEKKKSTSPSNFIYLIQPTILDKIFRTKWSNPVKLDRKRKVCIFFCLFLTAIGKV